MYETLHRKKGAGVCPPLNFWKSIYYSMKRDKERAREYYDWVLERVEDYIPDQIFENNLQVSVSPSFDLIQCLS